MALIQTLGLRIDATKAVAGAKAFAAATTGIGTSATVAGAKVQGLAKNMRLLVGGLVGLFVIRDIVRTIIDFEKAMATVQVVTKATDGQMRGMAETARHLGATTRFSANEAAEGMIFLSRAGYEVAEVNEMISHTLNLATAAVIGLGEASNMVANTIHQFNLEAYDAERVVDALLITANNANTDVLNLGIAMQYAGTLAGSLRISLEEVTAALGVMANQGIKGSMAGTQMRGVLAVLISPTDKVKDALKRLGLTIQDVNPVTHDLADVFNTLNEAGKRLNDTTEFAAIMLRIFARRPVGAALALSEMNEEIGKSVDRMHEFAGETKLAASIMDDTLFGALKALTSSLREAWLALGELGGEFGLRGLIDVMTGTVRMMVGMQEQVKKFRGAAKTLSIILKVLIARFVAMVIIKTITWLIGGLTAAWLAMTKATQANTVATLANPWGMVAITLGIAIAAVWEFVGAMAEATRKLEELHDTYMDVNDSLIQAIATKGSIESIRHLTNAYRLQQDAVDLLAKSTNRYEQSLISRDIQGALDAKQGAEVWTSPMTVMGRMVPAKFLGYEKLTKEMIEWQKEMKELMGIAEDMDLDFKALEKTLGDTFKNASAVVGDYSNATVPQLKDLEKAAANLMDMYVQISAADLFKAFKEAKVPLLNFTYEVTTLKTILEDVWGRLRDFGETGITDEMEDAGNAVNKMSAEMRFQNNIIFESAEVIKGLTLERKIDNMILESGTALLSGEADALREAVAWHLLLTKEKKELTKADKEDEAIAKQKERTQLNEIQNADQMIAAIMFERELLQATATDTETLLEVRERMVLVQALNAKATELNATQHALYLKVLQEELALLQAARADKAPDKDPLAGLQERIDNEIYALSHSNTEMERRVFLLEAEAAVLDLPNAGARVDAIMAEYDAMVLLREQHELYGLTVTEVQEAFANAMTSAVMSVIDGSTSMVQALGNVVLMLIEMILQAVIYQTIMNMIGIPSAGGNVIESGGGMGPFPDAMGGVHIGGVRQQFAVGGVVSDGIQQAFEAGGVVSSGGMYIKDVRQQFAMGGVVTGGGAMGGVQQQFAGGGIVSQPTIFPMAYGGVGLMGEAGPEAIMPLTRMGDGTLGVKAEGGSGGGNILINMNVTSPNADSFRKSQKQITRELTKGMRAAAAT